MSEIFHRQGIGTERVLCIIDIGKGQGIGVRAHNNLIRPAHLFRFLKQNDYKNLRRATDYFIQRQVKNGAWNIPLNSHSRFDLLAERVAESFARLAARLDSDYIFVWLDWDGDNILADGSIIDYGSVRQFGLRHDQYRYDDVDRFSTNLNEQKNKAREIVQTFVQMADYLKTGRRRGLEKFFQHPIVKLFDRIFDEARRDQLAYRLGLDDGSREKLLNRNFDLFNVFEKEYRYFERHKTTKPAEKVADGINRPAIFNMRDLLRELPQLLIASDCTPVESERLFDVMVAATAPREDKKMNSTQGDRLQFLQLIYLEMIDSIRGRRDRKRFLRAVAARSASINRSDRITGNSVTVIVDELMQRVKDGLAPADIQDAIETFIESQVLVPKARTRRKPVGIERPRTRALMKTFFQVVEELREDI